MNNLIRQQYLDAIGIQSWQQKSSMDDAMPESLEDDIPDIIAQPQPVVEQEPQQVVKQEPQPLVKQQSQQVSPEPQSSIIEPEPSAQEAQPFKTESPISDPVSSPDSNLIAEVQAESKSTSSEKTERPEDIETAQPDLELNQAIKNCKLCPGRQTCLNALAGQGNNNASVFIISEAPNAEEDRAGHYLTEQTMSLFQSMLRSINAQDDYFFTGIIKCHSLSEFLISEDEINHCASFLHAQITHTKPSVLLVLGAAQAQTMLQSKQSFN